MSTKQLQCAWIHLAGLLVRPNPRVHSPFAHQSAVADRLLDRSGLLGRERLARNEIDAVKKRFLLVFNAEILAIMRKMVRTDHDLGERERRESTLAIAKAVSSAEREEREGISITAEV